MCCRLTCLRTDQSLCRWYATMFHGGLRGGKQEGKDHLTRNLLGSAKRSNGARRGAFAGYWDCIVLFNRWSVKRHTGCSTDDSCYVSWIANWFILWTISFSVQGLCFWCCIDIKFCFRDVNCIIWYKIRARGAISRLPHLEYLQTNFLDYIVNLNKCVFLAFHCVFFNTTGLKLKHTLPILR